MKNAAIKNSDEYIARLSTASPLSCVIINYEILIDSIEEALQNHTERKEIELQRAKESLDLLIKSLNMDYEISQELLTTYIYVNKLLCGAKSEADKNLAEALSLIKTLYDGWKQVEKDTDSINTVEQVYAGLTYTKEGLEEYTKNDNEGFTI